MATGMVIAVLLFLSWASGGCAISRLASLTEANHSAWLGRSGEDLRHEFGGKLHPEKIERRRNNFPVIPNRSTDLDETSEKPDEATLRTDADEGNPFRNQSRLVRPIDDGDVQNITYELWHDRVYRVRWQLGERFERPIMASLVERLTPQWGSPSYDQRIDAKFGSGRSTLQRVGWQEGAFVLEIRQLHPSIGGETYLTLSDWDIIREIVKVEETAAPEPDSTGPWWQAPVKDSSVLTDEEREKLVSDLISIVARVDWNHER